MARKLMADPASLGQEVKSRTLANLPGLLPAEEDLFKKTKVIAAPDKYFDDLEKEQEIDFNVLGYAPEDPFVGKPFHRPEVYVRQKPVTPALTLGNIQRTGTEAFITPEQVLPHEIGHVMSQQMRPKRTLAYKNLDDEPFAMSFDDAVTDKKRSFSGNDFSLRTPVSKRQRTFEKLTYDE